jgi:hypothetical protein
MKKILLGLILLFAGISHSFSQDSLSAEQAQKPLAKAAFESGILGDVQTVALPPAKTLEFVLQHRFGAYNGDFCAYTKDLMGIWGSSNIRFGLNFSLSKNVLVGIGTTKNNVMQDFQIKYTFLRQRKGGAPVSMGVYGNAAISCLDKDNYGPDYKFVHRMSYYAELMIAKRFCKEFSAQVSIAWVHYNLVDSLITSNYVHAGNVNNNVNISGIGRIRISPQSSLFLSYSQPIMTYLNAKPWPNCGLGLEVSTSTHAFQVYLAAANGIVPQEIAMYNRNDPFMGAILIGFNLTRLWSF